MRDTRAQYPIGDHHAGEAYNVRRNVQDLGHRSQVALGGVEIVVEEDDGVRAADMVQNQITLRTQPLGSAHDLAHKGQSPDQRLVEIGLRSGTDDDTVGCTCLVGQLSQGVCQHITSARGRNADHQFHRHDIHAVPSVLVAVDPRALHARMGSLPSWGQRQPLTAKAHTQERVMARPDLTSPPGRSSNAILQFHHRVA